MEEQIIDKKGFRLLDSVEFLVRRKVLFLLVPFVSLVMCYVAIYVLVDEQFEATAVIIPREDDAANLAAGVARGLRGLPFGLGQRAPAAEMDLYKTIIYSRTMMEDVIREFDLIETYDLDTSDIAHMERAIKRLRDEVETKETKEGAFLVTVRAGTRQGAADMTNYIVRTMNERIIELKVSRSRENRVFLEQRVQELNAQLKTSEDSLRAFQERSGLLDAKKQLEGILLAHTTLETELTAKRVQRGILEKLYDKESPQVRELEIQIREFEKKLTQMRTQSDPGSALLPLKQLPQTGVEFIRRYRDVEINNLLIQYVVPLYEQAKIEERRDYPILQVIDYAVPPAKKSYPPRILLSLIGSFSVTLLVFLYLLFREKSRNVTDPRLLYLFEEAKRWKWKTEKP